MREGFCFTRILAFLLIFTLLLPNPAFALRPAGLEESNSVVQQEFRQALGLGAPVPETDITGVKEGVLVPDDQLPESVQKAQKILRSYLSLSGAKVWEEHSGQLNTRKTGEGIVHLGFPRSRKNEEGRTTFLIPPKHVVFIRQAFFPEGIRPQDVVGLIGFHLGKGGTPDLEQSPVVFGLLYRYQGRVYLRVEDKKGRSWESPIGIPSFRTKHLWTIKTYQIFSDLLKIPATAEEAHRLAEFLLKYGVKESSYDHDLWGTRFTIPKEHAPALGVFLDKGNPGNISPWGLIRVENGSGTDLEQTPWILVHRSPLFPDQQLEIFRFSSEDPEVVEASETSDGRSFAVLKDSKFFRELLEKVEKRWVVKRPDDEGMLSIGLGDRITFIIRFRSGTQGQNVPLLLRRSHPTDIKEGADNQVLIFEKPPADIADAEAPENSPKGLLFLPERVRSLEQEALVHVRLPYQNPKTAGQFLQVFVRGKSDPLFEFRTLSPPPSSLEYSAPHFSLHFLFYVLGQLDQRKESVFIPSELGPAVEGISRVIREAHLLDELAEPAQRRDLHYRLIFWNKAPGRTPWVILDREEAAFLKELRNQGIQKEDITVIETESRGSAGREERRAAQGRVQDFLGGLEEAAPQGTTAAVIGAGLEERYPFLQGFSGLEEHGIYVANDPVATIAKLVGQDRRNAKFVGLEEEGKVFAAMSARAGISVQVITPKMRTIFFRVVSEILAQWAGVKRSAVETYTRFHQFLRDLKSLALEA